MRPQEKKRESLSPVRLYRDLALLICESRLPDPVNGKSEGPHCPQWIKTGHPPPPNLHATCPHTSFLCQNAMEITKKAMECGSKSLPLSVEVRLQPNTAEGQCKCPGILLEKWTFQLAPWRSSEKKLLAPQFSLQAVWSHLHFSQLSAWLIKASGKLPLKVAMRTCLAGEEEERQKETGAGEMETHSFPSCSVGKSVLTIRLQSLPRQDQIPSLSCLCQLKQDKEPTNTNAFPVKFRRQHIHKVDPNQQRCQYISSDAKELDSEHRNNSASSSSSASLSLENPLFSTLNNDFGSLTIDDEPSKPVLFYFDSPEKDEEAANLSSSQQKRKSQKILFTSEKEVYLSEGPTSPVWSPRKTTSFTEGHTPRLEAKRTPRRVAQGIQPQAKGPKPAGVSGHISRFHSGFNSFTGLPLNSSPAPLKRNQYSFDYDSTLHSVTGIRKALYHEDSGSSDSESGATSLCKSAPASSNLLGNFEESALNGRIKPFGSLEGFALDLAASGAFCPPHITLPVATFFFDVSDDNAPSPYMGHCSLENAGKKGYHLPRKGTVQATLFNPQGTVVKMFVVRYDMGEMPVSCQTFVRQRSFYMPSTASLQDAIRNRCWLRYLIHLRFATSRSGKLYLHTDLRMLFSRKSELESFNSSKEAPIPDMGSFELRSFTEMPKNPKFSPRKFGSRNSAEFSRTDLSIE